MYRFKESDVGILFTPPIRDKIVQAYPARLRTMSELRARAQGESLHQSEQSQDVSDMAFYFIRYIDEPNLSLRLAQPLGCGILIFVIYS